MSAFWLYAGYTLAFILIVVIPLLARLQPDGTLAWSDRIATVINGIGKTAAWLALALMLVIIFDVITRAMKGSDWIQDWPFLYATLQGIRALCQLHQAAGIGMAPSRRTVPAGLRVRLS